MAQKKNSVRTTKKMASKAAKVLSKAGTSKLVKSIAASSLSNRRKK